MVMDEKSNRKMDMHVCGGVIFMKFSNTEQEFARCMRGEEHSGQMHQTVQNLGDVK